VSAYKEPAAQRRDEITPAVQRNVKVEGEQHVCKPVDPAIRTTHMCQRIVECGF